jgi:hypothetical protein
MSDVVWQALIGAVVACYLGYLQTKTRNAVKDGADDAKVAAGQAASKVGDVKKTLENRSDIQDAKLDAQSAVLDKVHMLVNSGMGVQLKSNMELTRWKATQTGLPDDLAAAVAAESLYRDHIAKQLVVDQNEAAMKTVQSLAPKV